MAWTPYHLGAADGLLLQAHGARRVLALARRGEARTQLCHAAWLVSCCLGKGSAAPGRALQVRSGWRRPPGRLPAGSTRGQLTSWRGERTTRRRCGCRGCQEGLSPAQNPTLGRQGSRSARPPRKAKSSAAGTGAPGCWVGCSALGGMWWRNGSGWAGRGCEPLRLPRTRRAVGLVHKRWVQCGGGAAHARGVAGCINRGPCLSSKGNHDAVLMAAPGHIAT